MQSDNNSLRRQYHQLRERISYRLWEQDHSRSHWTVRLMLRSCQILYAISRDLKEGQLSLRAMSLVYSTILGFIPLIALVFAVLKSLGVHNAMEPALLTLLEALGDRREEVTRQIIEFVDNIQVQVIGITSIGLLVFLVLDMMRKIESSFNYIWSVSQERSWSSRVSEYLFAVIVSPLLLFISISITSSVNTNIFTRFLEGLTFGSTIISAIAFILPLLFMSLAFAFAYSFLPNTRVQFRSAFLGGTVTTIVWKMMGAFFQGYFITAARESIYLAFATVIAVMIFTYFGWLVALLGSNIAYYHQFPLRCRTGRQHLKLSATQQDLLALSIAALVLRGFQSGQAPLDSDQLANRLGISNTVIDATLARLIAVGLLVATAESRPRYVPATAVQQSRVVDIWRALRTTGAGTLPLNPALAEVRGMSSFLSRLENAVEHDLGDERFVPEDETK